MEQSELFNLDAEQALLGAMLINNDVYQSLQDILRGGMFFVEQHQKIYEAMTAIIGRGGVADPMTMRGVVGADIAEFGGDSYLGRIAAKSVQVIDPRAYAEHIRDFWLRRVAVQEFTDCTEALYAESDETAHEIIARACGALDEICSSNTSGVLTRRTVIREILEDFKRDLPCHSTGINALDDCMDGGLYEGRAYAFTARKKQGKTMLTSTISYNLEMKNVKHLLITAEMSPKEIEQRRLARQIGVNEAAFRRSDFRSNNKRNEMIADVSETCGDAMLYRRGVSITFDQLRREVSACVRKHKIKGFILDYLQLVGGKPPKMSFAEFTDQVAQWIAQFCREANVFAIVIAQMNQTGSVRGGEGLLLAFDQAYELKRHDKTLPSAWLEMMETRYTPWKDVGDEYGAGLILDDSAGPHFREM